MNITLLAFGCYPVKAQPPGDQDMWDKLLLISLNIPVLSVGSDEVGA